MSSNRLLIAYSAVLTAAVATALTGQAVAGPDKQSIGELTVERLNVREPDGTLRLVISNKARFPDIIVRGKTYPHTDRRTAGMLFFNDEGSENGGLIWDGQTVDGKRMSGGSLTFDRYEQDQTIQLTGTEDGSRRRAGLVVNDQPEEVMDFAALPSIAALPAAARPAAYRAAHIGGTQRAFLGRQYDGASELVLRDAAGRPRLTLSVTPEGGAAIRFLDDRGKIVRTVMPAGDRR